MPRSLCRVLAAFVTVSFVCAATSGCRHVVTPLDLDFDRTAIHERVGRGEVKHVRYKMAEVKWDSNGIGDIARRHGMEAIYYADLETLSILGLFTEQTVHVYGR